MSNPSKCESYSEAMDEDSVMEEEELDDIEDDRSSGSHVYGGSATVYTRNDFGRFDAISIASPSHSGIGEALDEKGDSLSMLMHMEKAVVHKKFYDDFADDFDEGDLA